MTICLHSSRATEPSPRIDLKQLTEVLAHVHVLTPKRKLLIVREMLAWARKILIDTGRSLNNYQALTELIKTIDNIDRAYNNLFYTYQYLSGCIETKLLDE